MKNALLITTVAFLLSSALLAQTNNEGSRKSLKGLAGLEVRIGDLNPDLAKAGIYASQIQTDVELRLRMAGIKVLTEQENILKTGDSWLNITLTSTQVGTMELWVYGLHVQLSRNIAELSRNIAHPIQLEVCNNLVSCTIIMPYNLHQNVVQRSKLT